MAGGRTGRIIKARRMGGEWRRGQAGVGGRLGAGEDCGGLPVKSAVVSCRSSPACFAKRRTRRLTTTCFSPAQTRSYKYAASARRRPSSAALAAAIQMMAPSLRFPAVTQTLLTSGDPHYRLISGTDYGALRMIPSAKFLSSPDRIWSLSIRQYWAARTAVPPTPPFSKAYIRPEPGAFSPHPPDSTAVAFSSWELPRPPRYPSSANESVPLSTQLDLDLSSHSAN